MTANKSSTIIFISQSDIKQWILKTMNFETKDYVHIGAELVIIGGISAYFFKRTSDMKSQITSLQTELETLKQVIKAHDQALAGILGIKPKENPQAPERQPEPSGNVPSSPKHKGQKKEPTPEPKEVKRNPKANETKGKKKTPIRDPPLTSAQQSIEKQQNRPQRVPQKSSRVEELPPSPNSADDLDAELEEELSELKGLKDYDNECKDGVCPIRRSSKSEEDE